VTLLERLAELERIEKAGTSGKWKRLGDIIVKEGEKLVAGEKVISDILYRAEIDSTEQDDELAVAARNALPGLIEVIRVMQSALKESDCTCGSEGDCSDFSHIDGGCIRCEALARAEKLLK